jgi:hypothetical protein
MLVDSGIAHRVVQFGKGTNGDTKLALGFLELGPVNRISPKLVLNVVKLIVNVVQDVDEDSKSKAHLDFLSTLQI